jgi:DNA-directed RNA polymerase subunit RPC12/RpoP
MTLREPTDAKECVYITNRYVGEKGEAMCWVFREMCAECGKGLMGKPRGDDGKVKIRSKEYVCPECNYAVEKQEYEDGLTANIRYTCDKCSHEGELQIPFKRKSVKGTKTLVAACESCGEKMYITKKMKEIED